MREYTPKELDWEYHREYEKYTKPVFPHAFKSREHFQQEYDKAPLTHLTHHELKHLDYSTAGSVLDHKGHKMNYVRNVIGTRRDVNRIESDFIHGSTAPPIVLKHSRGLRIMSGNTRLMVGAAYNSSVPVKLIDISHIH